MLVQYGDKHALLAFKKRNHNVNVEKYALNRHNFETIVLSGNKLVQLSEPVYQPVQSCWRRAPFMSSVKQLRSIVLPTYGFNLGVIWSMTLLLLGVLCFRLT